MKEKIKPLYLVIKKIFNGMLIFSDIGWCFFFGGGGQLVQLLHSEVYWSCCSLCIS